MGFVDVPIAQHAGFIVVRTDVNLDGLRGFQNLGEREVRGGIERGVAAENEQGLDFAALEFLGQRLECGSPIGDAVGVRAVQPRLHRFGERDCRANRAEFRVNRMSQSVRDGGKAVPRDDRCLRSGLLQIGRNGLDPRLRIRGQRTSGGCPRDAEFLRQFAEERLDFRRLQRQAVIGDATGAGRHRLDRVDAAEAVERHAIAGLLIVPDADFATAHRIAGIANATHASTEEVGFERQNHVGFLEVIHRVRVFAERELDAFVRILAADWLVLQPLHLGQRELQFRHQRGNRRRGGGFGQHAEACALLQLLCGNQRIERRLRLLPGRRRAVVSHFLRAIRIVQPEYRGLCEQIARAEASGVRRVAFGLDRAAFVALDQQARSVAADRHRRGEEQRHAGRDLLGLVDVRDDLATRCGLERRVAPDGTRERNRRAHQL